MSKADRECTEPTVVKFPWVIHCILHHGEGLAEFTGKFHVEEHGTKKAAKYNGYRIRRLELLLDSAIT